MTIVSFCRGVKLTVCLLLTLFLFYAPDIKAQESPLILVLSAEESGPYVQARKGFEEHLKQDFHDAEFLYHHIEKGAKITASQVLSGTKRKQPAAIFSLGSRAAELAQTVLPDYPLVAAMILKDSVIKQKNNQTGILQHFSAEVQLEWVRKFLPEVKRVGILYDPALNSDWVKEAESAAQKTGIEVITFKVNTPKQLISGLKYINKNADVLLAIPDQTVYSGKTAKQVLVYTYRNRIPFVGLSASWVKAGALYALEVDYRDLGRQAAELIKKNLAGTPPETSIFHPEKVAYSVNSKIIDYLRLEINPDLIKRASRVFD
jgi:putative ABC transport system substrate-binding protein